MNLNVSLTGKPSGVSLVLVAGSGVLMALAIPPYGFWPLAWMALVPLWYRVGLTGSLPWWTAAGYGLAWGLGFYGSALSWITALHPLTWMGVSWLASLAIAAVVWLVVALWGTSCVILWAVGVWWITRHTMIPSGLRILLATAGWCGLETVRNYTPLDWLSLSLTQSPGNLAMVHLAQLSGPMAVTAVLVASNGLLTTLVAVWLSPSGSGSSSRHQGRAMLAALMLVVLGSHGLGTWLLLRPVPAPREAEIKVGMVQGNVPTREKLTSAGIQQAVSRYVQGYTSLVRQGADMVITPEGALPVLWDPSSAVGRAMINAVRQQGVPLWLGTFAPVSGTGRLAYSQSLLELTPNGQVGGRYNKIQLVPLGEYIPLQPILGAIINRLSPLDAYLTPGKPDQRFISSVGPAIVGICYESAYSRLFRHQARQGGEFIVTASNNDPYPWRMMMQHHGLDVLRAVETSRWAVRVTNTGLSALVNAHGHTEWMLPPDQLMIHSGRIERLQTITPYTRWGDWLTPTLCLSGLAGLGIALNRSHRT